LQGKGRESTKKLGLLLCDTEIVNIIRNKQGYRYKKDST